MNRQQFDESMKRVLQAFSVKPADVPGFVDVVFETCQRWSGYEFDQVTKRLVETHKIGRPKPAEFIGAYRALASEQGWNNRRPENVCSHCDGLRVVYTGVKHVASGMEYAAVKPCPSCARGSTQLRPVDGYEPCPDAEPDVLAGAAMLTPKGALKALDFAHAWDGGARLRDDVRQVLEEIAATTTTPGEGKASTGRPLDAVTAPPRPAPSTSPGGAAMGGSA